jgi:F-type H+-transporting ATPase subunit c
VEIVGSLSVIGYGIAVVGAGLGVGLSAFGATQASARQPEMHSRIFTTFIMGCAFAEALGLIGFVLALIK